MNQETQDAITELALKHEWSRGYTDGLRGYSEHVCATRIRAYVGEYPAGWSPTNMRCPIHGIGRCDAEYDKPACEVFWHSDNKPDAMGLHTRCPGCEWLRDHPHFIPSKVTMEPKRRIEWFDLDGLIHGRMFEANGERSSITLRLDLWRGWPSMLMVLDSRKPEWLCVANCQHFDEKDPGYFHPWKKKDGKDTTESNNEAGFDVLKRAADLLFLECP